MRRSGMPASGNYPPGTGPGDPNAPWNAPDPPTCPGCDRHIAEREDHADECPHGDLDAEELGEYLEELHKPTEPEDHPKYEERLEERAAEAAEKEAERQRGAYEAERGGDPDE